jgi:hypothetical protein
MARILVGTSEGLYELEGAGAPEVRRIGADDSSTSVTALARSGTDVLGVVGRHDIWRTSGGREWSHVVTLGNLELRCLAATDAGVLVGMAEAHLARLAEPPTPVQTIEGFERVEGRDGWYTPWGGPPDTRSISEIDESIFVNVHVGGIVRTRDAGETWEPTIDIHTDVHEVWAGEPGVFAACALGLAVSEDRGDSWRIEDAGLHATYCRAVTVCGDTVLVSASNGPRGGRAAVYRRALGGGQLERCRGALPEWFDGNVDSAWLDATPELVAFGTPEGRVFASQDEGSSWDEVAWGLPPIECLLVMP